MTAMGSSKIDLQKYARLVACAKSMVIETKVEYQRADDEIGRLLCKEANHLSAEEKRLLLMLSRLMEHYEDRTFPVPTRASPQTLQFLLAQNDWCQADLVSVLGARGRVSEVDKGEQAMSQAQAEALAAFFKVSPGMFP
jgi:HTH-type transcriptional regulator / antitoxin HigA